MRKLKFYLLGLGIGLIFVFFILNEKNASCSYFPNDRVIAETLTKEFQFTPQFKEEVERLKINNDFLKKHLVGEGNIDFSRSNAQQEPCPEYLISYPKESPEYEVVFEKCKDSAVFKSIKKL